MYVCMYVLVFVWARGGEPHDNAYGGISGSFFDCREVEALLRAAPGVVAAGSGWDNERVFALARNILLLTHNCDNEDWRARARTRTHAPRGDIRKSTIGRMHSQRVEEAADAYEQRLRMRLLAQGLCTLTCVRSGTFSLISMCTHAYAMRTDKDTHALRSTQAHTP